MRNSSEGSDEPVVTALPELTPITTRARLPNESLWALLTKAGPLSAAEWELIERYEREGSIS